MGARLLAPLLVLAAVAGPARAEGPVIQSPPEPAGEPSSQPSNPPAEPAVVATASGRPRFQVAIGLGLSVDHAAAHPDGGLPAFFVAAGLGDGVGGLELRSFANGATQQQVIRLDLELVGVLRPLAIALATPRRYATRVLRTLALDVGPGTETATYNRRTQHRWGLSTGAHLDFPVGGSGVGKELRLRAGVRRFFGGKVNFDDAHDVGDTVLEVYGQLAFVF
jgi:hypothetical protein